MHIVRLIQALCTDQEAKIRWTGSHTDSFKIGKGVGQHLHRANNKRIKCNRISNKGWREKISTLRYADDTALCTKNHEEATRFINELNKAGEEKSLKLNAKKTKYIHIGETDSEDLFIDADKIERVDHFK